MICYDIDKLVTNGYFVLIKIKMGQQVLKKSSKKKYLEIN